MHAAAVWLRDVAERLPGGLEVHWRYFSLDQVNNRAGEGVLVWEGASGFQSPALDAFAASEAARRQGRPEQWERFHMALLKRRHTGRKEQLSREILESEAANAGLAVEQLRRDTSDPSILEPLAHDHQEAVAEGIFGTPTFVFDNGQSAYLKMLPALTGDEGLRFWEQFEAIAHHTPSIAEIKRPRKPRTA